MADRKMTAAEAEKQRWDKADPDIRYEGSAITLPDDPGKMSLGAAIDALERKKRDEDTTLNVHEFIDAYPYDALVAFNQAMKDRYGWASPTPKMTFWGPEPPQIITVRTGPDPRDKVQVPQGQFTIPGIENPITVEPYVEKRGKPPTKLVVYGECRKREQHVITDLCNDARRILAEKSIYRGKAVRLRTDEDNNLVFNAEMEFLRVKHFKADELILNEDERDQINAALWTPIRHTEAVVAAGIPLNRGVLLEGTYGTGKTMTASVTAAVCLENGWTYILLDKVEALAEALEFAQRYQPAVLFAEDIDRVIDERDDRGNDLLNVIDGVVSKSAKVITVLTTNHVEKIEQAMLRPGRLDAVISIRPPEDAAVQALIKLYARDLLQAGETLDRVSAQLAGNIPATIREVVERAKLSMISRQAGTINEDDLIVAANGMSRHLELLQVKEATPTLPEQLAVALRGVLTRDDLVGEEVLKKLVGAGL